MPDFAPTPGGLSSLKECDQASLTAVWRVSREMLIPALPGLIFSILFLIHTLRFGFGLLWIMGLGLSLFASYYLFWHPSDPIHVIPILSDKELEARCRDLSFGANKLESKDKILVVGAGFAGMAVCASLIRRGIPFDLVDSQDDIGGLWYTGGYENVHILSSRKITEYKDYPMPSDYPENPSQELMIKYFRRYAEHWGLWDFAKFNTYVKKVTPIDEKGSSYSVILESATDGVTPSTETREYRGVVACVGHHRLQRDVHKQFAGTFTGEVLHSSEYKKKEQLKGKSVLVVGSGNSAMDISVDAAVNGKNAHSSIRTGRWFLPRSLFGMPSLEIAASWWPAWFVKLFHEAVVIFFHGFYGRYNISFPTHRYSQCHPTISTSFLENVLFGEIITHPDIRRFDNNQVTFTDGSTAEVDLIIYCTGYNLEFPLLDGCIKYKGNMPRLLYGIGVPQKLNLFCFGVHQPRYGGGPLLSRGAEVVAEAIELQRAMADVPVFDYVSKLFYYLNYPFYKQEEGKGAVKCRDWITCPFSLCKRMQIMRAIGPLLPRLSRRFPLNSLDEVVKP